MTTARCSKDSVAAERCLQGALLAVSSHSMGRAVRLCSNAVRFAPEYSPLLSRAYALRASILTQLCFYQEALKDCQILSSDTKMNEELKCKVTIFHIYIFTFPFFSNYIFFYFFFVLGA